MEEQASKDRGPVSQKFLEFQKTGLESYIRYLESELKNSKDVDHKTTYHNYLEREIASAKKRIAQVVMKLSESKKIEIS